MEKIAFIYKNDMPLHFGLNELSSVENVVVHLGERQLVEASNNCVQPICAGILLTDDNKIMVIKKSHNSTGINSPEKDKSLIYVGGHLDESDYSSPKDNALHSCVRREIMEELGIEIDVKQIGKPFVVYTPNTEKSARHFGILFPVKVREFAPSFSDGSAQFLPITDAKKLNDLEDWSRITINEITKNPSEKTR